MWIKVGSEFPRHKKVMLAGARLGRWGSGRVIAIWVEGMGYCNDNLTGGFLPRDVVHRFVHDKAPLSVADAMATPVTDDEAMLWGFAESHGRILLWVPVPGGWRVHDYDDYNGVGAELSKARSEAGRKGGLRSGQTRRVEANTEATAKQLLQQTRSNCFSKREAIASSKREANSEANPKIGQANAKPGTGTYLLLRSKCTEEKDTHCDAGAPRCAQPVENADRKPASTWKRALAIAHAVIDAYPNESSNWHPETRTRLIQQDIDPNAFSPRGERLSIDAVAYAEQQRRERGERLTRQVPKWRTS